MQTIVEELSSDVTKLNIVQENENEDDDDNNYDLKELEPTRRIS
jgi:hypothetical protein